MPKEIFSYHTNQLSFNYTENIVTTDSSYYDRYVELLSTDLNFHNYSSSYATHNFHSFPAKFPPQLPAKFILGLTDVNDVVLDPMMGSGTTILEAVLNDRKGIGFDIDPLALTITKVKTTPLEVKNLSKYCKSIIFEARKQAEENPDKLKGEFANRWDPRTRSFIDYWFAKETQIELMALVSQIANFPDNEVRAFLELAFSSTIITKSGGVSLALDLAHTRPHRAKIVISRNGRILSRENIEHNRRTKFLTKKLRSPIEEFEKRCLQNMNSLIGSRSGKIKPELRIGNAQSLPLENASVELIVTSPPYASNAIDYMRAHKFSLIWLGYNIDQLSLKRKQYIGSEDTLHWSFEDLPEMTSEIVSEISKLDRKKGTVLQRYYSEMKRTLREMYRVLKPGKAAVVVVGSSIMRGKDTQTQNCLADIGKEIGFEVARIGIRQLDRNKRMLPVGGILDKNSQIQQRMHEEYVIGFYKS